MRVAERDPQGLFKCKNFVFRFRVVSCFHLTCFCFVSDKKEEAVSVLGKWLMLNGCK